MIIKPRTRGFICTTAHPDGCERQVREQIDYVKSKPRLKGPRNVLVIGASTGYGLAARIAAAFGAGAATVGVYRPSKSSPTRTASAGWYNSAAFEKAAEAAGLKSFSVTGDAFAQETKQATAELIRRELGQVDLVVYSVATARRTKPETGETFNSVLKPIGQTYTNKTVDFHTGEITSVSLEPATEDEIRGTVEVMGGEDWEEWMNVLEQAGVLSADATTIAYSYLGPALTQAIYRDGTIGRAKDHLEATGRSLHSRLSSKGGRAYVVVGKALVTQSSAAIPIVPLYIAALYKVMKEKGIHEGCIEQMHRLFAERLYTADGEVPVDELNRIRIDDWEMREDVQSEVSGIWEQVSSSNIYELTDLKSFRKEFFQLFGFESPGVDYEKDTDPEVPVLHRHGL